MQSEVEDNLTNQFKTCEPVKLNVITKQTLTLEVFEKIAVTVGFFFFFSHAGNSSMRQAGLMTDHYIFLFFLFFFMGVKHSENRKTNTKNNWALFHCYRPSNT